jgi:hypothetical protein
VHLRTPPLTPPSAVRSTVDYPTTRQVSADVVVLQRSALMASALACGEQLFLFVTSSSGPQPDLPFDLYRQPQEVRARLSGVQGPASRCRSLLLLLLERNPLPCPPAANNAAFQWR